MIFAPDLIEYEFVGVSLSETKWEETIKINHATQLLMFALVKLLVFAPLVNVQKKACQIILHFSTCINLFEMPEDHIIRIRTYPYANLRCTW